MILTCGPALFAPGLPAPVATNDTFNTNANQAVTVGVTANDSGSITSIAIDSQPSHGTATVSGLTVVYTPAGGYYGTDSFTYHAIGPGGSSAAATVSGSIAQVYSAWDPTRISAGSTIAGAGAYLLTGALVMATRAIDAEKLYFEIYVPAASGSCDFDIGLTDSFSSPTYKMNLNGEVIAEDRKYGFAVTKSTGVVDFYINGTKQGDGTVPNLPTGVMWYPAVKVGTVTGGTSSDRRFVLNSGIGSEPFYTPPAGYTFYQ